MEKLEILVRFYEKICDQRHENDLFSTSKNAIPKISMVRAQKKGKQIAAQGG